MSNEHVEPAFPTSSEMLGHNSGMTLRDYFAGQFLAGAAAINGSYDLKFDAEQAYKAADAMLAERAK